MRYLRTYRKEVCIKKCTQKFCILSKELTLVLIGTSAVCIRVNFLLFMYLFGNYCNQCNTLSYIWTIIFSNLILIFCRLTTTWGCSNLTGHKGCCVFSFYFVVMNKIEFSLQCFSKLEFINIITFLFCGDYTIEDFKDDCRLRSGIVNAFQVFGDF